MYFDEVDVMTGKEEFEERETDFDLAFSYESYKRLSCFPHTLQLVVSKFNECRACNEDISKSKKSVPRVNKSIKATEMSKKLARVNTFASVTFKEMF